MKLALATIMMAAAGSAKQFSFGSKKLGAPRGDIKADSKFGQSLLSKARRVEENDNNNNQNDDEEFEPIWVSGYSVKFQGCHHMSQWNEEADGQEEVKVQTKRLVRFRLCPTSYCSDQSGNGCDGGYGDYIVDMNMYLAAYTEYVQDYWELYCEKLAEGDCACENDDNENCEYDCYVDHGVEENCADENPYEDDEVEEFELEAYIEECANYDFPDNDNNRDRKLNQEEVEYFIGAYCAEQGGEIHLGLFTDETCSVFADEYGGMNLFKEKAGIELPFGNENIIDMDCLDCMEPKDEDEDNNNGNDQEDEDEVREICEQLYQMSGKCEQGLSSVISSAGGSVNNNACNYMNGIKIFRSDGTVDMKAAAGGGANKTASIFIGVFAVAFVLLAAYVYYLKTKLDRASINLAE